MFSVKKRGNTKARHQNCEEGKERKNRIRFPISNDTIETEEYTKIKTKLILYESLSGRRRMNQFGENDQISHTTESKVPPPNFAVHLRFNPMRKETGNCRDTLIPSSFFVTKGGDGSIFRPVSLNRESGQNLKVRLRIKQKPHHAISRGLHFIEPLSQRLRCFICEKFWMEKF